MSESSTDEFLDLIKEPFDSEIQTDAVLSALGTSLGFTAAAALLFCLLRPYNTVVYAPRLKHADSKHAPPPVGKGVFAWVKPIISTKEQELVDKIGLDGTVFLRFIRMCRHIFLVLSVIGIAAIIPLNMVGGEKYITENNWQSSVTTWAKMTPQYLFGDALWAFVACAYVFDAIICYFLWRNYRAVTRLRRAYFESPEYQNSLHARTLMITNIPKQLRSDEGVVKIADEITTTTGVPTGAIARNVKDLPDLIEQHSDVVRELEEHLAKYLKNPNKLPPKRPMCRPHKDDPGYKGNRAKVDAIDYLTTRIRQLEGEIKAARQSLDKRDTMPYGFASYESIEEAHGVAYAAKHKHPEGATVKLAPKPNDLIWKNLPLSPGARRFQRVLNNIWVAGLTLVWVVPNALIAVFLANLDHLGLVWPAFKTELSRHKSQWAVVQGILAPALTSLFYYFLPSIFRRLSMRAGDVTKTSRERHVVHQLYAFFVFNNLIVFSLFAACWEYVAKVIDIVNTNHESVSAALLDGDPFGRIVEAFCNVSPFWISWLLQRNLGAAIDLSQLVNLALGSFARKFKSPTPRQLIELTAPPPFDYASYYNYFLFYSTVALCFGLLQPLILPVCAFYFCLDSYLKKYLLLYVFVTKNESGGQFWRILFNRFIFAMFLFNVVIALMVSSGHGDRPRMLPAMVPLPFLLALFKWYCKRTFDDAIHYYNRGVHVNPENFQMDKAHRKRDRVGVRFGHPALYQPLMTPMVHAKSQHLLAEIYRGRLDSDDDDNISLAGYSDTYNMGKMSRDRPGKSAASVSPFEIVPENKLDFENYKNRPDFREEHGGEGMLYGYSPDMIRPGTPSSFVSSVDSERGRSPSRDSDRAFDGAGDASMGHIYPAGYHQTPSSALRGYSPGPEARSFDMGTRAMDPYVVEDVNLLRGAAPMPLSSTTNLAYMTTTTDLNSAGAGGGGTGPDGYQNIRNAPTPLGGQVLMSPGSDIDDTSYDYFRGRTGRR